MTMNNRNATLDLAKGLLITLVVLGHAIQYSFGTEYTRSCEFFSNIVFKSIYSFHMPLFMLISGYLFFYSNKKDFKSLAYSKLKAIGIPMLSFYLLCDFQSYIPYINNCDVKGFFICFAYLIFRGGAMWFLASLLINITILATITRSNKSPTFQYLAILIVFIGSMFVPDTIFVSRAYKYMFPFFCIGYIIKKNNIALYSLSHEPPNTIKLSIMTLLSILAINWFDSGTYIYTNDFCIVDDYLDLLCLNAKRIIIALIVSFTFMQYMRIWSDRTISAIQNLFIRLGQISLFVYGFNIFFDTIYTIVLRHFHINIEFNYYIPILFSILIIILALFLYHVIEKNRIARILLLGK